MPTRIVGDRHINNEEFINRNKKDKYVFVTFDCDSGSILYKNGEPIMCRENFTSEDWRKALGIEWRLSEEKYGYDNYDKMLKDIKF